MKTAICLSGLVRSVKYNWDSLYNNIINQLNADIFVHTWNDSFGSGWDNNITVEDFFATKNILKCKFDSFHNWTWGRKESTYESQSPMFYSIYESNKLKSLYEQENNFKYDLVIRARMDCLFREDIPQKEIDDILNNKNVLYVRGEGDNPWVDENFRLNGNMFICDIFMFGTSETMDLISSIYENDNLLKCSLLNDSEKKFGKIVETNNIQPKLSQIRFNRQKQNNCYFSNYLNEGYKEIYVE